jgi:hypothetical protein
MKVGNAFLYVPSQDLSQVSLYHRTQDRSEAHLHSDSLCNEVSFLLIETDGMCPLVSVILLRTFEKI